MINTIFKIAVMVIIGSAFIAVLNSIKVNSFDPATQNASGTIEDFGRDKFVQIGFDETKNDGEGGISEDPDFSRRQFEGLLVWNMLAASDCLLLHIIEGSSSGSEHEVVTKPLKELRKTSNVRGYTDDFNGWSALKKADFDMKCAQAGSIGFEIGQKLPSIPSLTEKRARQPGNDMEGNFGKTYFNISRTFGIDSLGDDDILLGLKTKYERDSLAQIPDFWSATRASVLLPPGLDPKNKVSGQLSNHMKVVKKGPHKEGKRAAFGSLFNNFDYTSDPPAHKFSAWRPNVKGGTWVFENGGGTPHELEDNIDNGGDLLRNSLKNGKWYFCMGTEGYVISKAQSFSNLGEASKKSPPKEDSVFPSINIDDLGVGETCQPGGPEGFINPVNNDYDAEHTVNGETFSCSRFDAANKTIIRKDDVRTELGYNDQGEMKYLTYGCGLDPHTFDFSNGDHNWGGDNQQQDTNQYQYQGEESHSEHAQHFDGDMDYYTPRVYDNCPAGTENYNILGLKENIENGERKALSSLGGSVNFNTDQFKNVKGVEIVYEKSGGANLEVDLGGQTISVNSGNSDSEPQIDVGSTSASNLDSYESGAYKLELSSIEPIADDGTNSVALRAEAGEGQTLGGNGAEYHKVDSFDISKQDSGEIVLREVSVDAKPAGCS